MLLKVDVRTINEETVLDLWRVDGVLPYGRSPEYVADVENASSERLAQLVKICGFLLQTKVYLFWQRSQKESIV